MMFAYMKGLIMKGLLSNRIISRLAATTINQFFNKVPSESSISPQYSKISTFLPSTAQSSFLLFLLFATTPFKISSFSLSNKLFDLSQNNSSIVA